MRTHGGLGGEDLVEDPCEDSRIEFFAFTIFYCSYLSNLSLSLERKDNSSEAIREGSFEDSCEDSRIEFLRLLFFTAAIYLTYHFPSNVKIIRQRRFGRGVSRIHVRIRGLSFCVYYFLLQLFI